MIDWSSDVCSSDISCRRSSRRSRCSEPAPDRPRGRRYRPLHIPRLRARHGHECGRPAFSLSLSLPTGDPDASTMHGNGCTYTDNHISVYTVRRPTHDFRRAQTERNRMKRARDKLRIRVEQEIQRDARLAVATISQRKLSGALEVSANPASQAIAEKA